MEVILHFFQHSSKLQRSMKRKRHAPNQENSTGAAHVKGFGCHLAYRARINTLVATSILKLLSESVCANPNFS